MKRAIGSLVIFGLGALAYKMSASRDPITGNWVSGKKFKRVRRRFARAIR